MVTSAFTQKKFIPQFGVGFHAGKNYTNMDFDPNIRPQSVDLNNFGVIFNVENKKGLGAQIEFNYSERGWIDTTEYAAEQDKNLRYLGLPALGLDTSEYSIVYKRNMEYLEIPILTHFNLRVSIVRVSLNFGAYIAFHRNFFDGYYLSYGDSLTTRYVWSPTYEYHERYGTPTKNVDMGYIMGGSIGIETAAGEVQLRARATQGIKNQFERYPDGQFKFSRMKSFYVGASYIYHFNLRSR